MADGGVAHRCKLTVGRLAQLELRELRMRLESGVHCE